MLVKEQPFYRTHWICEKWSEEAVDFARRELRSWGVEVVPHPHFMLPAGALAKRHVDQKLSEILGRPIIDVKELVHVPAGLMSIDEGVPSALLHMIVGSAEIIDEVEGNLLVNEGIQRLEDLSMISTGLVSNQVANNAWNTAQLGVGDSSTAEAATQTELQAATNRFYAGMNSTFPSRSGQQVTFTSDFTTANANYVWAEWTIANTSSGSPPSGTINLNRKVAALGTKASGTWTLTAQLTLS